MNFKQIGYPNCRAIAWLASDTLYRNSFFMAFTNIFNVGCGFFFWMIAARLYTVEQVGLATALISSLGLVMLFSRLGFDSAIIRFLPLEDRRKVISTSLIVTSVACIISGVVCILMVKFLDPSMLFLMQPGFALAFLLIGSVNLVADMIGYVIIADRKADHYLLQNLFIALRVPALLFLASLGVFGIFGSVGFGYLAASCFGLATLRRSIADIQLRVDLSFIRKSFKFFSWNYISNILYATPTLIIPIMILRMLGEFEAAMYYIAFAIGNLVLIVPSSFGTSLFVEGSHGEGLKKNVIRAIGSSFMLMIPMVVMLFFFGDQLLGLLREDYIEAFDLLRIIAISSFLVACYSLFIPIQNVRMKGKSIIGLSALRCALLLGLSYVLIQRYGILGAGYAWMAAYGVIAIVVVWIVWSETSD